MQIFVTVEEGTSTGVLDSPSLKLVLDRFTDPSSYRDYCGKVALWFAFPRLAIEHT